MASNKQMGQGMTEYIIIVALIAITAIGVYSFFGKTIRNQVAGLSSEVSGQDSSGQISNAKTAADDASNTADSNYNLSNYNEGANKTAGGSGQGGGDSGID
ncbi:pilus assembly protein [Shewanella algae]|uniref:Flp family type IVb pilin n=1 Tax=Shewanella algae TaxID=38313 RepID=UPI000D14D21C|nr:pilus assembly protein [Shewanella algae]MBO2668960.1 pilus assembly protein [Shewanella algae]PST65405.1 pilus assembly protein [Shewanella algae]TWU68314.1 pilus assembly protein [Shewanella algae]